MHPYKIVKIPTTTRNHQHKTRIADAYVWYNMLLNPNNQLVQNCIYLERSLCIASAVVLNHDRGGCRDECGAVADVRSRVGRWLVPAAPVHSASRKCPCHKNTKEVDWSKQVKVLCCHRQVHINKTVLTVPLQRGNRIWTHLEAEWALPSGTWGCCPHPRRQRSLLHLPPAAAAATLIGFVMRRRGHGVAAYTPYSCENCYIIGELNMTDNLQSAWECKYHSNCLEERWLS